MQLESVSDNYYVAPASPEKGERTFGGQLLAHTLRAAQISVDSGNQFTRPIRISCSLVAWMRRPISLSKLLEMGAASASDKSQHVSQASSYLGV